MNMINQTMVKYFIIRGISTVPELQAPIFLLVLIIYLFILGGNMIIVLLVCSDRHLHTPMYLFLANLSMVDISCSTVSLHKILDSFVSGDKSVPYLACMVQIYFFASLTYDEQMALAVMSYDRYVAICNPLRYHVVMNQKVCALLTLMCWISGFIQLLLPVLILSGFSCYTSNEINHFLCDMVPLMEITCDDTTILQVIIFTAGLLLFYLIPLLLTSIPYIFIITTILRICSSTGRRKVFYTCSSHLTLVILLYVSIYLQYLTPKSTKSTESNKLISMFNTVLVPIVNPLIYSLKNKDVKSAMKRKLKWCQVIT
ncbi:olfactory receptor 5B21-like [Pseudophryne corroboree]|uniref:olfactory receptor 5B21-like n=1 Tax=Pseudophryne corroboree TaxID=495146 RepID=UPI003081CFE5